MAMCRSCGCERVSILLQTGDLPVSNGYLRPGNTPPLNGLVLGSCRSCGLLQLVDPFPAKQLQEIVPKWVFYKEPEEHLDEVCARVAEIIGQAPDRVGGVSALDTSLVARFRKRGWTSGSESDGDLAKQTHLESVVGNFEAGQARHPEPGVDFIVARHILDHVRQLEKFLASLGCRVAPRGRILFEVPSSAPFLQKRDPLMLWESHANYFTEQTLQETLLRHGFAVEWCQPFRSNDTDLLVALARKSTRGVGPPSGDNLCDWDLIEPFVGQFAGRREAYMEKFARLKSTHKTIALLGAGHMGNLFINLYRLGRFFDFAFDDDPSKANLCLPGSNLPILPTAQIGEKVVGLLVLSVNRNIEERVAARLRQSYPDMKFASIFPDSEFAIL
jgi:C-methyltransferase C-terminal domain/Methyltransferase domain